MNLYLPLPGQISRKRRRHWKKQIINNNPGLNPEWLDARYELALINQSGIVKMLGIRNQSKELQNFLPH
jgi:hypothetical protein